MASGRWRVRPEATSALGAGVDILLRMGFRASYTFTSNKLNFTTDNGDGSDALNMDDVGTIKTHTATIEVMRYMLPAGATSLRTARSGSRARGGR